MASVDQLRARLEAESPYYIHYAPVDSETSLFPAVVSHESLDPELYEETEVPEVALKPVRKVSAAGIAGALSILIVFVLGQFNVEVTNEVASAITAVLAFGAGYMVPAAASDEQVISN